ncbi:hypothetical protein C8A03DRAFT_33365 [Achaetomium macrosporum]|uniref:Uncharacterized protein n=1 Tax=Achaetomium macrosporum TaxID=79813 RepID=A0AAN7CC36_9PEZI|nr:hypothetical protein C8A03DRAFT_33365 [Achaetomium macrosporum]
MPGMKAKPLTKPAPSVYVATTETDIPLSGIFAELEGTAFDRIVLRDVKLMSATQPNDITPVGLALQATVSLGDVGKVSDDFNSAASGIFAAKQADVKVAAFFGTDGSWASALKPRQFTLKGTFENIDVNVFDIFHVTELGAYIRTFRRIRVGVNKDEWPLVLGFFGTLRFSLPGSPSASLFSFEIDVGEGVLSLAGNSQGSWSSAFGIPNLSIDNMSIYGEIRTSTRSLDMLQVAAALTLNDTTFDLRGLYTPSPSQLRLSASASNFTLESLLNMFAELFGEQLSVPDGIDITFEDVILTLDSSRGFTLSAATSLRGHTAASALITFSTSGVSIEGSISDTTFGEVAITNAEIRLELVRGSSGLLPSAMIIGDAKFRAFEAYAGVNIFSSPLSGEIEWTVFGELKSEAKQMRISDIDSHLDAAFLRDISFSEIGILAASSNQSAFDPGFPYPVKKGVQICATIEEFPLLSVLLQSRQIGLLLGASFSSSEVDIGIRMPPTSRINFGRGVISDPPGVVVTTNPRPGLHMDFGLTVPAGHGQDLHFAAELFMDEIGASASALMEGFWVNPFGISEGVKVGPQNMLKIDIIFVEFLETGLPSGLAFAGSLTIGRVSAALALSLNVDPRQNFLFAKVDRLALSDVLSFGREALRMPIPENIPDFLQFEGVSLSIAPAGGQVGTMSTHPGFSFSATMLFFGEHILAKVTADQSIFVHGEVEAMTIGPLKLSGLESQNLVLDAQFGASAQHILVDAALDFLGRKEAIHIEIKPEPFSLSFKIHSSFLNLISYDILATASGQLSEPQSIDVQLTASFEQHILELIANLVTESLIQAANNTQRLEDAQAAVDKAKRDFNAALAGAEDDLARAERDWVNFSAGVRNNLDQAKAAVDAAEKAAQKAQEEYDKAFAKRDGDAWIRACEVDLQKKVDAVFKSAIDAVQEATARVDAIQADIDDTERRIDELTHNGAVVVSRNPNHPELGRVNEMFQDLSRSQAMAGVPDQMDRTGVSISKFGDISVPLVTRSLFSISLGPIGSINFDPVVSAGKGIGEKLMDAADATAQKALDAAELVKDTAIDAADHAKDAGEDAIRSAKELAEQAAREAQQAAQDIYDTAKDGWELSQLLVKLAALQASLAAAKSALEVAQLALDAAKRAGTNAVVDTAATALDAARTATDAAIAAAQLAVADASGGVLATALESAQDAMDVVQHGGAEALAGSTKADLAVQKAVLAAAQGVVDDLATSVQYAAFKAAEQALQAVHTGSLYIAFETAKQSLEAAKQGQKTAGKILEAIKGGGILDIKRVELSASMKEIVAAKKLFVARIFGRFMGSDFPPLTVDFNPRREGDLIVGLFRNFWGQLVRAFG